MITTLSSLCYPWNLSCSLLFCSFLSFSPFLLSSHIFFPLSLSNFLCFLLSFPPYSRVYFLLISSPVLPSWLLSLMWLFCASVLFCVCILDNRVSQLWLIFYWLNEKLSAKLKQSSTSICTLDAVFPFISQSIPPSCKYTHIHAHIHPQTRKLKQVHSSILFLEQYIIHLMFMFLFYILKHLLYFCVVVDVVVVIDGVLYISRHVLSVIQCKHCAILLKLGCTWNVLSTT